MNAVKKAELIMQNKYRHPVTQEQHSQLRSEVDRDLNHLCLEVFDVEYKKLPDQGIVSLSPRLNLRCF